MKESKRKINIYSINKMLTIIRKVCADYSSGEHTIESVCENAGVPYRTFRYWWTKFEEDGRKDGSRWTNLAEVAALWETAQNSRNKIHKSRVVSLAENMLTKRIQGFTYEETTTHVRIKKQADGTEVLVVVGMTKVTRHALPSEKLIQFALRTLCPEIYGERTIAINLGLQDNPYDSFTLEQLDAEIKALEDELKV